MRRKTRNFLVGNVGVGSDHPVTVQSMTTIPVTDVEGNIRQINLLYERGCEIIRLAFDKEEYSSSLEKIVKSSPIPVVADIQFDARSALGAIRGKAAAVRLNPGLISDGKELREIARAAIDNNVAVRVGANSGSIGTAAVRKRMDSGASRFDAMTDALVEGALTQCRMLEEYGVSNIKVALKASDVRVTCAAVRKFAALTDYPLHLGVTEAGTRVRGSMKSAIGIGSLLMDGIGDTIRVSLTAPPEEELGSRLILRTTKSIEITSQGWDAYRYASKILDLRDCIIDNCTANAKNIIRIGASTIPATYVLPNMLARFAEESNDTYFNVSQTNGQTVVDGVYDGQFDLGFAGINMEREGVICQPFCRNRMVIITPVTERYLNLQNTISPREMLLQNPVVLREKGSQKSANRYLTSLDINEEEMNVVARVNDQETVKNMVATGMGISLISELAARDMIRARRLLKFELPDFRDQNMIYLYYRGRFGIDPAVQNFIDYIKHYEV